MPDDAETIADVIRELREEGPLRELLTPDRFAPTGKWADVVAQQLGDKMKVSQLRRFFGEIKRFQSRCQQKKREGDDDYELVDEYLLLPEIAYASARRVRGQPLVPRDFCTLVETCISDGKIEKVQDMKRFIEFMTAIVAYHKQYE